MMRYLGIDYGKKRIGLAISDEDGKIAFSLSRLFVGIFQLTVKEIKRVCEKENVGKIIIGVPVTFSGSHSGQTDEVLKFGQKLADAVKLPVEYQNEILSTKLAERSGAPKHKIDSVSAAIILQSYLDKLH